MLHKISHVFFFNDTATTEIYTLSLHDALPISRCFDCRGRTGRTGRLGRELRAGATVPARRVTPRPSARRHASGVMRSVRGDRKSTRLNSSHANISYAVFCLKKKKSTSHVYIIT